MTIVEQIRADSLGNQAADQVRYWRGRYEGMGAGDRALVDTMCRDAQAVMKAWGLVPAQDDRAEALVAALARYVVESRGELS